MWTLPSMAKIPVDAVGTEERAAKFTKRSIKKESKREAIELAIRMIDLTTLEGKDSPGKINTLCQKAIHPLDSDPSIPSVAAVCVYPSLISLVKKYLEGTNVKAASVATGFPSGQTLLSIKMEETKRAVEAGADEIDMVLSRGDFLSGRYTQVFDEIAQIKECCGKAHLKVILETGELETYDHVRKASFIAMQAGADFIKTSTGKAKVNATLPVTLVMCEAIRDYWYETGRRVGMKPAGGIKTTKEALQYLVLVKETLGEDWLTPNYFRFGASTLLNDLLMQLMKEATGNYQSIDYFTVS